MRFFNPSSGFQIKRGGGSVVVNADGSVTVVGNTDITGTLAVTETSTLTGNVAIGTASAGSGETLFIDAGGSIGVREGIIHMRDALGDSIVQINVRAAIFEIGAGGVLDTSPGFTVDGGSGNTTIAGTLVNTGLITATAGVLYGTTVTLTEGAANRLDLASGDSFNIVSGSLTVKGVASAANTIWNSSDSSLMAQIFELGDTSPSFELYKADGATIFFTVRSDGGTSKMTEAFQFDSTLDVTGISTFNDDVLVPSGDVRIGAGTASHSGVTPLFIIHADLANDRLSGLAYFRADSSGAIWTLSKSRSSTAGTILYPLSGDNLGGIWWEGADEDSVRFEPGAKLFVEAGSTWTATNHETKMLFQTVSSGATALTTILTLSNGNALFGGDIEIDGAFNHDGSTLGVFGATPVSQTGTYIPTNVTSDRAYDANSTTVDELADVLGTVIADLQLYGLLA